MKTRSGWICKLIWREIISLMLSCGHYMSIADNFKVSKGGEKRGRQVLCFGQQRCMNIQ